MKGAPLSCIIPCYNGARYLDDAIQSILDQTRRPQEIIVVDDGSTDGSAAVVARYGSSVRYHRRQNGGPAAACNTGIALTRYDFVAFLEQDDLWVSHKIERQLAAFEIDERLDYCVTKIQNFWEPSLQEEASHYAGQAVMQPVPGYVVQTLLARRRAFSIVGGFDESLRFACATDWFIRAEEAGARGLLLQDVLTHRRLHERNYSRTNRGASREQFLQVVKSMLDRRRDALQPSEAP